MTPLVLHRIRGPIEVSWEVGQALTLRGSEAGVVVRISETATLHRGGSAYGFVGSDPEAAASVAHSLTEPLYELQILTDGTLSLVFDGGARVTVPPHPLFEAWEVWQAGGIWVALPGGGVG